MTELEAYNYVPQEGDVIGNMTAARIACDRYRVDIEFKGDTHDCYESLLSSFHKDLDERGISFA